MGTLAALVAFVGISEAIGWPFLAAPMQSALTKVLKREVRFDGTARAESPNAGASAASASVAATDKADGVRIRLLGRIQVKAQHIEVAAPEWSNGPPTLVADGAAVVLRYSDLWRAYRGEPIVVRMIAADRLAVALVRKADGRASWQFGEPKPEKDREPGKTPEVELLQVRDGRLQLDDDMLDSDVDARYTLVDRSPGSVAPSGATAQDTEREAVASGPAADRNRTLPEPAHRGQGQF